MRSGGPLLPSVSTHIGLNDPEITADKDNAVKDRLLDSMNGTPSEKVMYRFYQCMLPVSFALTESRELTGRLQT